MSATCDWCGAPIQQPDTGRRRRFCNDRCRKAHRRAFPAVHSDLRPLPEAEPLPRIDPYTRIVFAVSEVRACECELRTVAHEVPAPLGAQCLSLADCLRRDVETLGGIFNG